VEMNGAVRPVPSVYQTKVTEPYTPETTPPSVASQ
jgi:hypothetical protein